MDSVERYRELLDRVEAEWLASKETKAKEKPVILFDRAKRTDKATVRVLDDWRYLGEPGKRQVHGFTSEPESGLYGEITTAPIIDYDHVTGTITTKAGNRYRLGSPVIEN